LFFFTILENQNSSFVIFFQRHQQQIIITTSIPSTIQNGKMSSSNINFIIFIYLYMRQQQQTTFLQSLTSAERRKLHSRYAKRYYKSLSIRERRNRYSAWRKLLSSNCKKRTILVGMLRCVFLVYVVPLQSTNRQY
jgi:hypothetical protein